jgi:hypothetical protein
MSKPMTPAPEIVKWLREQSKSSCPENKHNYYGSETPCYRCKGTGVVVDDRYVTAANLIEALTAERDGLAGQNVMLREALEMFSRAEHYQPLEEYDGDVEPMWANAIAECSEVLAIKTPEAAAQVAEWRASYGMLLRLIDEWKTGNLGATQCMVEMTARTKSPKAAKKAKNAK